MFDHFETLRIKELTLTSVKKEKCIQLKLYLISSPQAYSAVVAEFGEIRGCLSMKEYGFNIKGVTGAPTNI